MDGMFRITRIPGTSTTTLRIEGRLLKAWVGEFQATVHACSSVTLLLLDLSGLTFVDAAGLEVLATLIRDGAVVSACSDYVAELLQTVET